MMTAGYERAKAIGDRIRHLRESRGWSQEQLAASAGISQSALSKWERGDRTPKYENVAALAQYFGVDALDILKPS